MTAKDNANHLCMTFLMETDIPSKAIAKQSALVHVDRILEHIALSESDYAYYKEVKQEIEINYE